MAMRQQQAQKATVRAPANADHTSDWLDELDGALMKLDLLPLDARAALVMTINAFEVEDGGLPPAARWARELLLAAPPSHAAPSAALVARGPRRTPPLLTGRQAAVSA